MRVSWGRRLGLVAALPAVLPLVACGDEPEQVTSAGTDTTQIDVTSAITTTVPATTVAEPVDTAAPTSTPVGPVRVAITGVPLVASDGTVELCPYAADECFGIVVAGGLDRALAGEAVRIVGAYDGVSITPSAGTEPEVVDSPWDYDRDYSTPCEGMSNPMLSPADQTTYEAIAGYLDTVSEALAGVWIDQATQVMNYWFVGDEAATDVHRRAIEELAGDTDVCVIGGARYSEAELMELQERVWALAQARGITSAGSSTDTLSNAVFATFHVVDPALRTEVEEFSDAIRVHAFIELLDEPLDALPPHRAPVEGTVEILTQPDGGRGGMDALGTFTLRWDSALGCHYLEAGAERYAGVWPDGYAATGEPFTLYDFDGDVVATEGDTIETGGGFADITGSSYDGAPALCGANGLWIVTR